MAYYNYQMDCFKYQLSLLNAKFLKFIQKFNTKKEQILTTNSNKVFTEISLNNIENGICVLNISTINTNVVRKIIASR